MDCGGGGGGGGGRRTGFNTFQIPRKGKVLNIISLVIYSCTYFSLYGMLFLFPKSLRVFPACVLCDRCTRNPLFGSVFGKRDLLVIFHRFDCRKTTLSNAANHFKIFLLEFEICVYKHLYFLYIRNPPFPIVVFISMLWQLKVNMFYPKNSFPLA